MTSLIDYLIHSLRFCFHCHASQHIGPCLLCPHCQQRLNSYLIPGQELISLDGWSFRCFYLFRWEPDQHLLLSELIESLKGGGMLPAFKFFAEHLIQYRAHYGLPSPASRLIPSPARQAFTKDHAYALAHELAKLTAHPLDNSLLRRASQESQKRKSKRLRKMNQLNYIGPYENQDPIIFVDDVVTTGATARAAWLALNKPRNFEVWCLLRRGNLR